MLVFGGRKAPNENARTMEWRVCERVDKISISSLSKFRMFYHISYLSDMDGFI